MLKPTSSRGGKQRQQGLFAGKHHRAGFAQFADGIGRSGAADPGRSPAAMKADGADVRSPEQIAVGGFVDLFQRVFQLAVGDLQLGELQHQVSPPRSEFSSSFCVRSCACRILFCSLVSGSPSAGGSAAAAAAYSANLQSADAARAAAPFPYPAAAGEGAPAAAPLGAQGFAQQIGGAQPLRLLAQSV